MPVRRGRARDPGPDAGLRRRCLAHVRARGGRRVRPTASGPRARTTRLRASAAIRPSCCSIPTPGRSAAPWPTTRTCSGYLGGNPDTPSDTDSAPDVPRSLVVDPSAYGWRDHGPLRRPYADTVIYEVHVKGFTMQHPDVPPALRGTYAGLAHEAAISYLNQLGVTAVELLPVHEFVPEGPLVGRGPDQLLGLQHDRLLRPQPEATRPKCEPGVPAARSTSSRPWSTRCTRPGSRSSWTWCSTTRPRATSSARRCASAAWTTRPTTGWTTVTRGTTSTPPAPATRSTPATRARCS